MRPPPQRTRKSHPRAGDPVYDENRLGEDKQPNGVISMVDYSEKEVYVHFHSDQKRKKDVESYMWDELDGKWTDKFGGCYYIHKEG